MHQRIAQTRRWLARLINQQAAHSIQEGTALYAGHNPNLLEASLRAAADATAEDATQATNPVRNAEATAAAQVAQTLETDARGIGVALAAREAAAALLTDEHWARTADRASDLGEHELTTRGREARAPGRAQEMGESLAAAAERDSRAELRDRVADERERPASLRSFLGNQQNEEYEQHAGGLPMRRAAAMDRLDARTDPAPAACDRAKLGAHPSPESAVFGSMGGVRMSEVAAELSHDLRAPLSSIMASVEMLEAAPRALVRVDQKGAIRFVNRQIELMFGHDREQLIGRHVNTLVPEVVWEVYERHQDDFFADPRTRSVGLDLGLRIRRSDGGEFPIKVSLSHIDTGDVLLMITAVSDVPLQRQAMAKAELLDAIVEYSDDGIVGADLHGIITTWNPAAERLYGYLRKEAIGKDTSLLMPEDRADDALLAKVKDGLALE